MFPLDQIPENGSKGFDWQGTRFLVVRLNSQLYLYENRCPHLGIPLEFLPDQFLDREKRFIVCANHGALFEISSGYCVSGPCGGQTLTSRSFTIRDGHLYIQ